MADDKVPLKGFICCSNCTRTLCGSASKGRNAYYYYYYYHCSSKCVCRLKANEVNKEFLGYLDMLNLDMKAATLFKRVILDEYAMDSLENKEYKVHLVKKMTEANNKVTKARELLLLGDITGMEYRDIKSEGDEITCRVEAKLDDINHNKYTVTQLEPIIERAIVTLTNLNVIFSKSVISEKES